MTIPVQRLVTRPPRYHLVTPDAIDVRVEQADDDGESVTFDAELMNISAGGVRLCSATPAAEGDFLTVTLKFKGLRELPNPLSISTKVTWATLAANGCFHLGCSVEPEIPPILLDHLASCGILERRNAIRRESSLSLPARWELDSIDRKAEVLNISVDGVCLLMPQKGRVGDRLRLVVPGENLQPEFIYVRARWQMGTEEGCMVGCEFGDRTCHLRLVQAASAEEAQAATYNPLLSG